MSLPEVWLRGPVEGFAPVLMPAAHALLQVREDLERLAQTVVEEHLWVRPGGAASIGFHIRHTGGALDRLLTYARGETLSDAQLRFLRVEGDGGDPPASLASVVGEAQAAVERALGQLRETDPDRVYEERRVGRAGLPATVLGLIVHAAEHSTRHMGQAITTAKIVMGS
jgi:hypothetical protein